MGLFKRFQDLDGKIVTYWRIREIQIHKIEQVCSCSIIGYTEKPTVDNNAEALIQKSVPMGRQHFNNYMSVEKLEENNPYKIYYNFIKEKNPIFSDAIDVIE